MSGWDRDEQGDLLAGLLHRRTLVSFTCVPWARGPYPQRHSLKPRAANALVRDLGALSCRGCGGFEIGWIS